MRKLKTLFALLVLSFFTIGQVWAAEARSFTINFKDNGTDASTALTTSTFLNQVTADAGKDSISAVAATAYCYAGNGGLKVSSNNSNGSFTLTLKNSLTIDSVVLNVKNKNATTSSVTVGSTSFTTSDVFSTSSFVDMKYKGTQTTSNSITVAIGGSANKARVGYLKSMTIYHTVSGGGDPSKTDVTDEQLSWSASSATVTLGETPYSLPTLTNTESLAVTYQSTAEAVATINSSGVVSILKTGSTTIKAIYAGSETLNAKTVSYTLTVIPAPITTIADFLTDQPDEDSYVQFSGDVVVTGVSGKNVYVQDENGDAICLLFSSTSSWTKGHKVTGLFQATYSTVGSMPQMVIASGKEGTIAATEEADIPAPAEITSLATATIDANLCKYVTLKGVYFQAQSLSSSSVNLKDGSANTLKLYDGLSKTSGNVLPLTATACDVTGILIAYKPSSGSAYNELLPVDAACIVAGNATLPTLNPAGSTDAENPTMVKNGQAVAVTPASGFTCTLNDASLSSSTNVNITETESNTEIVVTATRDYYTMANATYYFKANPPAPKYAVTISQPANGGTLEANYAEAEEGFAVSLTAHPTNDHFTFDGWDVYKTDESTTKVTVEDNKFTMPAYAVTVTGSFTEDAKVSFSFAKGAEAATGDAPAAIENKYADDEITLPENPFAYEGYEFGGWKHSATNAIYQPGDYTVTSDDAAAGTITFTAKWNKLYTVTWNNNGDESVTTQVADGSKPAFPTTPESCDATSKNFYGWATAVWNGKTNDISAKTIYTKAADMPAINGADVTYYAVFCEGGSASVTITNSDFTGTLVTSYDTKTIKKTIGTTEYSFEVNACKQNNMCQMRDNATLSYISIPTLPGNIIGLSTTTCANASGNAYTGTLHFKSSKTRGNSDTDDIAKKAYSSVESFDWDLSSNTTYKSGYLLTNAGLRLKDLTITYATEATNYMTTCTYEVSIAEGIKNGSVSLTVEGESDPLVLPASLAQGTVVNVTANPASADYKLTALTAGEENILSTKKFTVGTSAVEVSATFAEKPAAPISWSAAAATVIKGALVNEFPTLTDGGLTVAYASSNTDAAEISDAGEITLKAAGSTNISATYTATAEGAYKTTEVSYTLTVRTVTSVAISETATKTTYEVGEGFDFTGLVATAYFNEGDPVVVTATAGWAALPATIEASTEEVRVTATYCGTTSNITVIPITVVHAVHVGISALNKANNPVSTEGFTAKFAEDRTDTLVTAGTKVTLVAVTKEGYDFDTWHSSTGDITFDDAKKANGAVATINGAGTITAIFRESTTPKLTIDKTELDFGTVQINSTPAAKTFTVTGKNLTEAVGYTWKSEIGYDQDFVNFEVTSGSLTPDANGDVNATVTVSPITTAIADYNGDLIITSTGLTKYLSIYLTVVEGGGTGVNNTEMNEKAVKTIENGVLIIRRGNKSFNAQGQLIK